MDGRPVINLLESLYLVCITPTEIICFLAYRHKKGRDLNSNTYKKMHFVDLIKGCLSSLQIWVQSPHNASGYYTIYGDDSSYQDHFNARLVTGNTGEVYARTGYLGFLRRTEAIGSDGGK